MRLWHKSLIDVLPDKQLISQWREIVCISIRLAKLGTPEHILVNRILEYPIDHFYSYTELLVLPEIRRRGYRISFDAWNKFAENLNIFSGKEIYEMVGYNELFQGWHSTRYLQQCILNLEEKYDVGGIDLKDWYKIVNKVKGMSELCQETFDSLFV